MRDLTRHSGWDHELGTPTETDQQRAIRHAQQLARDLAHLQAGGETSFWDEHGTPAPFPEDFFDHDTDWRPDPSANQTTPQGEEPWF
jgi:hypothetical protein